jgi:hypothetical protein
MQLTHHAYYIEGPLSGFAAHAAALKPFWAKEYERFGIEEARALIQLATLKNTGSTLYFIGAASITSEAQQALLKLFEEPQVGTTFVLLLPHGMLLPTLRSRMLPYPARQIASQKVLGSASPQPDHFVRQSAASFLKSSPTERSAAVTKLLKDEEGVRERAREFVNALEAELYRALPKNPALRSALEDVARVRSYLGDRSPSLKMLLEHLAATLPSRL